MIKITVIVFLILSFSMTGRAQDGGAPPPAGESKGDIVGDTKKDLFVVTGTGLAGAILGLSTLSFVDEPEDHYKNIIVGGALGIIGGVIVVASMQAERTGQYIDPEYVSFINFESKPQFDTSERTRWHRKTVSQNSALNPNQIFATSYSF